MKKDFNSIQVQVLAGALVRASTANLKIPKDQMSSKEKP
jgi:hypothetical protein